MKKYFVMSILMCLIIAPIAFSQSKMKSSFKADVEAQRVKNKKSVTEVKQQLEAIRKDIKERNLKFKVDMTEALKRQIEEITGAVPPTDLEKEAEIQTSRGYQLFLEFLQRLAEAQAAKRQAELQPEKKEPVKPKPKEEEKKEEKPETVTPVKPDETLPESFMLADPSKPVLDWFALGMMTPVKEQGLCGSCWSFTAMGVVEGCYKINKKTDIDLSEQYMIDCARDKYGRDAGSCNGGWYGNVFDFMMTNYPVEEKIAPYRGYEYGCTPKKQIPVKLVAWGYVRRDGGIPSVDEMKKALCTYGTIAATVKVTPAFQAYVGGIFDEFTPVSSPKDVNHGIIIVGWDDTKKAYRIKNSWGERWGEKGYMWIEYGCNNIGYGAAWVVLEKE